MDTVKNGWASSSNDCWTRLRYHRQQYLHLSKKRLNANRVSVHLSPWLLCMAPIKLKREGKYVKGIKWRERKKKGMLHLESNYNLPFPKCFYSKKYITYKYRNTSSSRTPQRMWDNRNYCMICHLTRLQENLIILPIFILNNTTDTWESVPFPAAGPYPPAFYGNINYKL